MSKIVFFTRPESYSFAMGELGGLSGVSAASLAPGAGLLEGEGDMMERVNDLSPLFLRHIHPADMTAQGEEEMRRAAAGLVGACGEGRIALQIVDLTGEKREKELLHLLLSGGDFDRFETAPESAFALSVTRWKAGFFLGFCRSDRMLTPRAGGIYRYAMTPDTVSRAAFKLTEVFERLSVRLPEGCRALDLGAAPGGWTRFLREKGALVTAVDPASLDPRVEADPGVTHYRGLSQDFLRECGEREYDLLVNDMRMDALQSARTTLEALPLLRRGGLAVITLKLPEKGSLKKAREATACLAKEVGPVYVRQLYHNRSEITFVGEKL